MEQISTIIVDDEPLAREGLSIIVQDFGGFSILAQCDNGKTALEIIQSESPDVVFVDIEMPGINGLELVDALTFHGANMPLVVFVTAFREFAINAFDYHAFDYLLKPYSDERLNQCLQNIKNAHLQKKALRQNAELEVLLTKKTGKTLSGFIQSLNTPSINGITELKDTIALKSGTQWLRIKIDDILWLEAAGDYVCVHTSKENYIVRKPLKTIHQELCQRRFIRLNRSSIVNLSKIEKLIPNSNGEYMAHLNSGDNIKVSRRYRLNFKALNAQL